MNKWQEITTPDGDKWLVDMKFLMSGYQCIWGKCAPIRDSAKAGTGCCSIGVTTDRADRKNVRKRAKELRPEEWANYGKRRLFSVRQRSIQTRLQKHDDGTKSDCIFYNLPGSDAPVGCALHIAAENRGEEWMDWKPYACVIVPLWVDWNDRLGMNTLQFIERDVQWSDLDHWCGENPEAFSHDVPAYRGMAKELEWVIESHCEGSWDSIKAACDANWENGKRSKPMSTPVQLRTSPK